MTNLESFEERIDSNEKLDKEEWATYLKMKGWPNDFDFWFDVNSWGSCQYSSALQIYNLYVRMREDLDREDVWNILGIQVEIQDIFEFDQISDIFKHYVDNMYWEWGEPYYSEAVNMAEKVKSYDDMFDFFKKRAMDLWSAAPQACEFAFKGFQLTDVPKSKGYGPSGNVLVQSENFITGICCALLTDYGLVKNDRSFAGFDT